MEENKTGFPFFFELGEGRYKEILSGIPLDNISSPESIRMIKKAIKLEPSKSFAYVLAGLHYLANKDIANAEKMFFNAVQAEPSSADLKKLIGLIYANNKNYFEALEYFCDYILAGNWGDFRIIYLISGIAENTDHPKVTNTLKLAWQKTLDDKVGYLFGMYSKTQEQLEMALNVFELIAENKDYPEYWNQIGIIQHDLNLFDESIEAFNKALRALEQNGPSEHDDYSGIFGVSDSKELNGILHANLANSYLDKGSFNEALSEANITIDLLKDVKSYEIKYNALLALNRVEEAIKVAQETIAELEPSTEGIIFYYQSVITYFLSKEDFAEAHKLLLKGLALYPDHLDFYLLSGFLHCKNNDFNAAINAINEVESRTDGVSWQVSCAIHRYAIFHLEGQSDLAYSIIKSGSEYDRGIQQLASQKDQSTSYLRLLSFMTLIENWINERFLEESKIKQLKSIILNQFRVAYPNDVELVLYEAYIHYCLNDYGEVKRLLHYGLKIKGNPYKPLFENNLAVIYMLEGNFARAKKLLVSHSKMRIIHEDLIPEFKKAFSHWITIWSNGRYEPPLFLLISGAVELNLASTANLVSLNTAEEKLNEATSEVFFLLWFLLDRVPLHHLVSFLLFLMIGTIELAKHQDIIASGLLMDALEIAEKNSILDEEGILTLRSWVERINQSDSSVQ